MMTASEPPTLEQAPAALADRADVDEALLDQWTELRWRNAQQIAEPVPAAELVALDCGHCTPSERPAEFNPVVSLLIGGSAASTS